MRGRKSTVVIVGDTHSGFEDSKAIDAAVRVIQFLQPDVLIHLGDLMDCYSLSSFEKDIYRLSNLQSEIEFAKGTLRKLSKASPKSKRYLLAGNHEDRLQRVVFSAHGEVQELLKSDFFQQNLNWPTLLNLDTFGFSWIPSEQQTYGGIVPNVLVKHGTVVRKYAGYSARAEFESAGVSGVSGHTHRLGLYSHTNVHGNHFWMETGCLCSTKDVHYISGIPNWQQGIGILTLSKSEAIPEVVPIVEGNAYLRGKVL